MINMSKININNTKFPAFFVHKLIFKSLIFDELQRWKDKLFSENRETFLIFIW